MIRSFTKIYVLSILFFLKNINASALKENQADIDLKPEIKIILVNQDKYIPILDEVPVLTTSAQSIYNDPFIQSANCTMPPYTSYEALVKDAREKAEQTKAMQTHLSAGEPTFSNSKPKEILNIDDFCIVEKSNEEEKTRRINYEDYPQPNTKDDIKAKIYETIEGIEKIHKGFPILEISFLDKLLDQVDKYNISANKAYKEICNILNKFETDIYGNGEFWIKDIKYGYVLEKDGHTTNHDEADKESLRSHLRRWSPKDSFIKNEYERFRSLSHLHYYIYNNDRSGNKYFITLSVGRRHIIE